MWRRALRECMRRTHLLQSLRIDEPRSCWERLTRICISESSKEIMKRQRNLENGSKFQMKKPTACKVEGGSNGVIAQKLWSWSYRICLQILCRVLNSKRRIRLRSLLDVDFQDPSTFDSIECLEGLESLTFLRMECGHRDRYKGY